MITKNNIKTLTAILILIFGLCSFKFLQFDKPNVYLEEEKVENETDSAKQVKKPVNFTITEKDSLFTKVDYPATFPGGLTGWRIYLESNLKYPKKAQRKNTQGVVGVILTVDKEGNISNVRALNDPGDGLAEEAERVIRISPNWNAAILNGKKVSYRFIQTVTFKLQ